VKDGEVIWKYEKGMESNPAIKGNRLFAASNGTVFCLDTTTGKLLWQQRIGDYLNLSGSINYISDLVATEKCLFFGIRDGLIFSLDLETGRILWKFGTGGTTSAPAVVDGHIIVIGEEGSEKKGQKYLFCFYDGDRPIKHDSFTTIQGKVTDGDNRPLGGASVRIAGIKTKTDLQGKYIVKLKNYSGNTLVQARIEDKKKWGYWFGEGVGFVNPGDTAEIDVKTSFEEVRP
jgi:outer membrane protein assembly factor BamB